MLDVCSEFEDPSEGACKTAVAFCVSASEKAAVVRTEQPFHLSVKRVRGNMGG